MHCVPRHHGVQNWKGVTPQAMGPGHHVVYREYAMFHVICCGMQPLLSEAIAGRRVVRSVAQDLDLHSWSDATIDLRW